MNERPTRRYKIWELAKHGRPAAKPESGRARQVEDLVALMALYDYRPLIQTELQGTLTLPNGGSANCRTTTISSEEVHLVYDEQSANSAVKRPDELRTGSAVHLDLDRIGAFHGVVAAKKPEGFQVTVDDKCKPEVRNKLAYIAAEHAVSLENGSAAEKSDIRIEPNIKSCSFLDHTGTLRQGTIVNLSQVDALIRSRIVPPLKSRIVLRGPRRHLADVMRTFEMGFVVKFCAVIRPEEFSAAIKFSDE